MVSRSQIKLVQSLKHKKYRQKYGLFCVSGDKIVRELLTSSFNIHKIYALTDWADQNKGHLRGQQEKLEVVKNAELERLSPQQSPNGVLALAEIPKGLVVPSLNQGWWVALDRMRDPGNLGTVIRTADWFGISGLLCSSDCVDRFNPKVVQASMGSVFRVPVWSGDLQELLSSCELPVWGATMDGGSMYKADFSDKGILLVGNEANGVSPELLEHVNETVSIPGSGQAESLNATIATAVLLSQALAPR